ncbi:ATP-dependent helicase [Ruthenibacterium lactatiformans]|uniref:ATP-dependent helicase n=1 Tax=Ruthenibacterium lactatiformans TaxID=1550024 RepID=UPI00399FE68E
MYRFRGATIENILNFEQHFPGAKVIRLEQNYRSTSNILNAANCVIKNNMGRKGKTLWTENGNGEKLMCYEADSEFDEAAHVAAVIGQNVKKGAKLRDHAILYRMNAQSGPIETYFARAGIPYKIVGGQRFYDRKEIKDMLAYMSIVANEQDDLRLRRIINEPARKIGATTVQNVADIAAGLGVSMLEVIEHAPDYPALARASAALGGFWRIYRRLKEAYDTMPLDVFVSEILEITGYRSMLEAEGEEGQTRMENIGQLVSSVKTYADQRGPEASLPGFLEEVALISDIDSYDEGADVVVLMTMHAAKGLEFNYVFIVGLEEGIFPSEMSRYSNEDLEEERRLCYVGITVRKRAFLPVRNSRMLFGQTKHNRPSRFLRRSTPLWWRWSKARLPRRRRPCVSVICSSKMHICSRNMARQACAPRYRRDIRPVTAALPTALERAALHALPGSALLWEAVFPRFRRAARHPFRERRAAEPIVRETWWSIKFSAAARC